MAKLKSRGRRFGPQKRGRREDSERDAAKPPTSAPHIKKRHISYFILLFSPLERSPPRAVFSPPSVRPRKPSTYTHTRGKKSLMGRTVNLLLGLRGRGKGESVETAGEEFLF